MRADIQTHPRLGPGHGVIRLAGPEASGPAWFQLRRSQGKEVWLGTGGWQATEHRFDTAAVAEDGAATLSVGPDVVDAILDAMAGKSMFQISGEVGAEKFQATLTVGGLLGSSARGPERPVAPPLPPEPEPPPAPDPVALQVETRHVTSRPEPQNGNPWINWGLALLVLGWAGGGGYWTFGRDHSSPPPTAVEAPQDVRAEVKAFLDGGPTPADARAKGDELAKAGRLDGALLVYRFAAEKGDPLAALALARMYDPATFSKETSPLPAADAETAQRWYEAAAGAGSTEARARLEEMRK